MKRQVENVNPYAASTEAKTGQVRQMFNNIARGYDVMNLLMTAGLDRRWRAATIRQAAQMKPERILDIATGTGDLAIAMAKAAPTAHVTGVDLAEKMVEVGVAKVKERGLEDRVSLSVANALQLPFPDNSFDVATVAFGVRNFEHIDSGYAEMLRVLRPGGKLCVLELTVPTNALVKPFYNLYTGLVIPAAGKIFAGEASAYRYLNKSIQAVPARQAMCAVMEQAGFTDARHRTFTLGVCALYTAVKPEG